MDLEKHRENSRRYEEKASIDRRNIGQPPEVVDPVRRDAAAASLQCWDDTYFPSRFRLKWSPDLLQVNQRIEEAIRFGGLYALAMPRGGGKTTCLETAMLWAALTGLHAFTMLLAVNATRATEMLDSIKTELLTNDRLSEDWPEVCHPIRALENRANKAKGQHIDGMPTWIGWRKSELVLPAVEGSQASGAIIRVAGLTGGGVRGNKFTRPHDGKNVRPSLCLLDDPQDDEAAGSAYQCEKRHRLIHGAVLGMAGPGKKITAVMPCTVIAPNDLSHQMLDREKSPLWTGQRYQLLPRFPERMDLWDEYGVRRADEFRNGGDGHLATAWYGQQKELMDRGAIASWPERHNPDELSAVQHAMNLYYLDKYSFFAEYQNDPLPDVLGTGEQLQSAGLAKRVNGLDRGIVPLACSCVTAYIDVQQKALYWLVAALADGFSGSVIDYGTYPEQSRRYFTLADIQRTLARAAPGSGLEGSIYAGLDKLAGLLLGREWKREDGAAVKVDKLLVDANWGASTDVVYQWCRQTAYSGSVMPAHGRYVGAGSKPWSEYQKKPGERMGFHWLVPVVAGKRATRHLLIDTNFWKTFLVERLSAAIGDRGSLTFWGKAGTDHQLLADHLTSEYRVRTEGRGRMVDEWKWRPERPDNHWWDCLTGAAAAASLQGVQLAEVASKPSKPRKKVSLAEMWARGTHV